MSGLRTFLFLPVAQDPGDDSLLSATPEQFINTRITLCFQFITKLFSDLC